MSVDLLSSPHSPWSVAHRAVFGQPYRIVSVLASLGACAAFASGAWPPLFAWMAGVYAIAAFQVVGWIASSLRAEVERAKVVVDDNLPHINMPLRSQVAEHNRSLDVAVGPLALITRVADVASMVLIAGYWLGRFFWTVSA